jgi:hypothetical protein
MLLRERGTSRGCRGWRRRAGKRMACWASRFVPRWPPFEGAAGSLSTPRRSCRPTTARRWRDSVATDCVLLSPRSASAAGPTGRLHIACAARLPPKQGVAARAGCYPPGAGAARLPPTAGGAGLLSILAPESSPRHLRKPQPVPEIAATTATVAIRGGSRGPTGLAPRGCRGRGGLPHYRRCHRHRECRHSRVWMVGTVIRRAPTPTFLGATAPPRAADRRARVSPLLAVPPVGDRDAGRADGGPGVPLRSRGRGEDPQTPGAPDHCACPGTGKIFGPDVGICPGGGAFRLRP